MVKKLYKVLKGKELCYLVKDNSKMVQKYEDYHLFIVNIPT